jgi:hypothetical protein
LLFFFLFCFCFCFFFSLFFCPPCPWSICL